MKTQTNQVERAITAPLARTATVETTAGTVSAVAWLAMEADRIAAKTGVRPEIEEDCKKRLVLCRPKGWLK